MNRPPLNREEAMRRAVIQAVRHLRALRQTSEEIRLPLKLLRAAYSDAGHSLRDLETASRGGCMPLYGGVGLEEAYYAASDQSASDYSSDDEHEDL